MRVLILGSQGQLGQALIGARWSPEAEILAYGRTLVDITSPEAVERVFSTIRPAVVVNAAAYTAVDRAEVDQERAFAVNSTGPRLLAEACNRYGAAIVHISTDYVFDGAKTGPYVEIDPTSPLGVYGRSKLAGEVAVRDACDRHVILRTAWVYSPFGSNFVKTMLRLAEEHAEVRVVMDQIGSPTSAKDLAACIALMVPSIAVGTAKYGTYHASNAGEASWHAVAENIFSDLKRRNGRTVKLVGITTSEYPTLAQRPKNSRLDCSLLHKNFGIEFRAWQDALKDVLSDLHYKGLP